MGRRSRKYRKRFPCGHQGFGKFCHRCATAKALLTVSLLERQRTRQQWQESFLQDCVDLTHLPKAIVLKARQVLSALQGGISLSQLRGKRFSFDRRLIRIPVTYRYRLVCRQHDEGIVPLKVVSHETYNSIAHNRTCF